MTKHLREVVAIARDEGIEDAQIKWRGRHPRVVGTVGGKPINYGFAGTPSDYRSECNLRAGLRRKVRQAS